MRPMKPQRQATREIPCNKDCGEMDGTSTSVESETEILTGKLLKHSHGLLLIVFNRGIENISGTLLLIEKIYCTHSVSQ